MKCNTDNSFGTIFDIQHFSINDGPGIRTTVFFKGCPLRCKWCHNPESYAQAPQILTHYEKCTLCGACERVCPNKCHQIANEHIFDSRNCKVCGICTGICQNDAITVTGKRVTRDEVIEEVMKDRIFYQTSGGGITLSGGEPMMQPEFALELAKSAKEKGLHVCIESCGFCNTHALRVIAPYVDLFLFDYKCADSEKHKIYTGVGNEKILGNLFALDRFGANSILRCPMIPCANMFEWHVDGIIQTASKLKNLVGIDLEPYHNIGVSKRKNLGLSAEKEPLPDMELLKRYAAEIEQATSVKTRVL